MPQIPTPIPGASNDNRPADDYNWGYLLSVGLNSYIPFGPHSGHSYLNYAVESSELIIKGLSQIKTGYWYKDYKYVVHLKDWDATFINVVKAILNIAANTKSGDAVTLSFSGHGYNIFQGIELGHTSPTLSEKGNYIKEYLQIGGSQNVMTLFDEYLSECELFFLLKFFKPGIKINLIFDMCHSGSWVTKFHMDQASIKQCYQLFEEKIYKYDKILYNYIVSINSFLYTGLELENTINIIGGIQDSHKMSDYLNSVKVLHATLINTGSNKPKLFKKLFYEMYENMMLQKMPDGANMWKVFFYEKYKNKKIYDLLDLDNKPILDKEGKTMPNYTLIPEYDNKNPDHVKIHKDKVPIFEYFGKDIAQYENSIMFGI
jgi:hypothetical protein